MLETKLDRSAEALSNNPPTALEKAESLRLPAAHKAPWSPIWSRVLTAALAVPARPSKALSRPVNPVAPPLAGEPKGSGPTSKERLPEERLVWTAAAGTETVAVPETTESEKRVTVDPSVCSNSTEMVCGNT